MKLIRFTLVTAFALSVAASTATAFASAMQAAESHGKQPANAVLMGSNATPRQVTSPSQTSERDANRQSDSQTDSRTDNRTDSRNLPEVSNKRETDQSPRDLGVCTGYISPLAEPDSFEYREGLDRCQYGSS